MHSYETVHDKHILHKWGKLRWQKKWLIWLLGLLRTKKI
jgi:hypothetical protein